MGNAKCECEMIMHPTEEKYKEHIRQYQGCPTLAITKGGRMYAAWCSGGNMEPHIDNYDLVVYSDDLGKTWSKPIIVFPSGEKNMTQFLDIQLWVAPDGRLFIFVMQDDVMKKTDSVSGHLVCDGYVFLRNDISAWMCVCDEPDAEEPVFSEPRCWSSGIMRTKPLVMSNGEWLLFNYEPYRSRYSYTISADKGKTFTRFYGPVKQDVTWAEPMAYEKSDGSVRMLARSCLGKFAEATSADYARTWTDAKLSEITAPDARLYISRTPSGRLILVYNDHPTKRCRMTVCLSEDDGLTWKYKRCIDERDSLSYPDVDFHEGKIYLIYDRERYGIGSAREILFTGFAEEDIMNNDYRFEITVISKPGCEVKAENSKCLELL